VQGHPLKPVKTILEVQPLEPIHVHTDGLLLPAVRKRFARHEERGLERMRVGLAILDLLIFEICDPSIGCQPATGEER
jgi:hypothetical protein